MQKWISIILVSFIILISLYNLGGANMSADNGSFTSTNSLPLNTSVNHLRQLWSDNLPDYLTKEYTSEQAISGEHIVKFGKASSPDGGNSKVVSIYYNCTDCHNLVREDPVLSIASPEDRLTYAVEHDLPFLQGTTLWGVVNRESWYNGDYSLKYGEYVEKARNNLQEAIQLCATQCAQGRPLEDWETDAVIAYLSTLQITLGDLNLSEEEYSVLEGNESSENKLELLKSKYLNYSPATFTDVPSSLKEGYEHTGDPGRGRQLYVASCQFCHRPNGPSELVLTDFRLSLKLLKRNLHRQNQYSLYYLLRVGTYSIPGHKPYMPHFTEERMSDQQVEDLRAYIEAAV